MFNQNFREKAGELFFKIYSYLTLSLLFFLFTLLGLGIFGLLPALKTSYQVLGKLQDQRQRERIKLFSTFKTSYFENLKAHYLESLVQVLLIFLLAFDIFYFSTGVVPVFKVFFYIFIILAFLDINQFILTTYLLTWFGKRERGELLRNSISLIMVNLLDILFLDLVAFSIGYFLAKISTLLLLILLPGIFFDLSAFIFKKMIGKTSLSYRLFNLD